MERRLYRKDEKPVGTKSLPDPFGVMRIPHNDDFVVSE